MIWLSAKAPVPPSGLDAREESASSRRRISGDTGSCVTRPGTPTASSIAAAMAAPQALIPPSPAPFHPQRVGSARSILGMITSTGGISAMVGIR